MIRHRRGRPDADVAPGASDAGAILKRLKRRGRNDVAESQGLRTLGKRRAPDDVRPGLAMLTIEPGQRLMGMIVPGSSQVVVNDFPLTGPTVSSE